MKTEKNTATVRSKLSVHKPRVLIAEDNQTIRELIALCLHDHCELSIAASGDAAWKLLQQIPLDLLVTDISMAGDMDGNALIKAVKNDPNLQSVQVLVISARAQQTDIELSLSLGADGYITKPFSPFKLISWIGKHLTSR